MLSSPDKKESGQAYGQLKKDPDVSLPLLIEAAHAICDLELVAGPMPPKKGPPLIVAAC